ncbi:small integral membrane protein 30 [Macaca thibetana thibetana]|nr:small integral membrane protein 30 [Macaca thibetana thibetana]
MSLFWCCLCEAVEACDAVALLLGVVLSVTGILACLGVYT